MVTYGTSQPMNFNSATTPLRHLSKYKALNTTTIKVRQLLITNASHMLVGHVLFS